jgi:hypothetical protein
MQWISIKINTDQKGIIMKKFLPYLPIILCPYTIIFLLVSMFSNAGYLGDGTIIIYGLPSFYLLSLIVAVVMLIYTLVKKRKAEDVLFINMVIKLIHIPTYFVLFLGGMTLLVTIFTAGISLAIAILDALTIVMTGLVGVGGVVRLRKENRITKKIAILAGISQFIYCIDVIVSVILFIIAKSKKPLEIVDD